MPDVTERLHVVHVFASEDGSGGNPTLVIDGADEMSDRDLREAARYPFVRTESGAVEARQFPAGAGFLEDAATVTAVVALATRMPGESSTRRSSRISRMAWTRAGEFHTFVFAGPLFSAPVTHRVTRVRRLDAVHSFGDATYYIAEID
jgi:predicted PhzF superfamily epimerase YddE/YHI9